MLNYIIMLEHIGLEETRLKNINPLDLSKNSMCIKPPSIIVLVPLGHLLDGVLCFHFWDA